MDEFRENVIYLNKFRPNLTECLNWFMEDNLEFSELGRSARLSCVKQIITGIETRKFHLLTSELQNNLENMNK